MLRAHGSVEGVPADSSMDAESATAVRAQLSSLLSSSHVGHEAVGVGHHVVPPTSGQVQHVTWSPPVATEPTLARDRVPAKIGTFPGTFLEHAFG
eukprot:1409251-Prymnesium_polylepis.2